MTWLGILKALVLGVGVFADWLRDRQFMEAGRAETIASHLESALDEIAKAQKARDAVYTDVMRDPGRLRDDDGFKRPD
ncbi:MAG TPA: hypothetical protein VGM72_07585 [Micropepsaceae bacterium]